MTKTRAIQYARFKNDGIYANAHMKPKHIRKYCKIDEDSLRLMETVMNRLCLSARAYNRMLKVACTIADIEGSEKIVTEHIFEAIQYRGLDSRMN